MKKKMWGGEALNIYRLKKMKLRWFGHVKRRDENSVLRKAIDLEMESRRPVGRPQKTWSKVVEET